MKITDLLLLVLSTFLLGTNFVAVKIGVQQFPPLFMMAMRFTLVAGLLIPFVKMPRARLLPVFLISVSMGTAHFGLFFVGISQVDAAVTAIIFQLGVPFSIIFAWIFLREAFGWRRTIGIAIAFVGVMFVAGSPKSDSSPVHMGIVLASVVAWGIAAVQIKRLQDVDAVTLTAWMALFSAPQLYLISAVIESGQILSLTSAGTTGWGALLYATLGASIVGYGLWYHLIGKYDVNQVVPLTLLNPLFAIAAAVIILGESLSAGIIVGGLLTLAGVFVVQMRSRQTSTPES